MKEAKGEQKRLALLVGPCGGIVKHGFTICFIMPFLFHCVVKIASFYLLVSKKKSFVFLTDSRFLFDSWIRLTMCGQMYLSLSVKLTFCFVAEF